MTGHPWAAARAAAEIGANQRVDPPIGRSPCAAKAAFLDWPWRLATLQPLNSLAVRRSAAMTWKHASSGCEGPARAPRGRYMRMGTWEEMGGDEGLQRGARVAVHEDNPRPASCIRPSRA